MKKLAAIAAASTLCIATAYAGGAVASVTSGSKATTNGKAANSSKLMQKVVPHHSTAQVMTKSTKKGSSGKCGSGKCGSK